MRDMIHQTPLLLAAAMMAHETNREYCRILGDDSHEPWDDAAQELRDSVTAGVIAINENPDISPEELHERWFNLKAEEGWTHGVKKDEVAKTHPCFLPYDALTDEQRFKDTLFGAVVRAVLFGVSGAKLTLMGSAEDEEVLFGKDEGEGPSLADLLGGMDAEELANLGVCRMMGPDADDPMASEGSGTVEPGLDDERLVCKAIMGACFDGEGAMVFFFDGSTARWRNGVGWKPAGPVPETMADVKALLVARAAEATAAAAESIEE